MKVYVKICMFLLLIIATTALTIAIKENYKFHWYSLYVQATALSFFFFVFLKYRENITIFIFSCILMLSFQIKDLSISIESIYHLRTLLSSDFLKIFTYFIITIVITLFYVILPLSIIKPGFLNEVKTIALLSIISLLIRLTSNIIRLKTNLESQEFHWNNVNHINSYILNSLLWSSIDIIFVGFIFFYLFRLKKHE